MNDLLGGQIPMSFKQDLIGWQISAGASARSASPPRARAVPARCSNQAEAAWPATTPACCVLVGPAEISGRRSFDDFVAPESAAVKDGSKLGAHRSQFAKGIRRL